MTDIQLSKNAFGHLELALPDGTCHSNVVPVRAFPLAAPDEGVALVGADGHELAWIAQLGDLPGATQSLVRDALARREFVPEISRIVGVSTFATPSTWTVDTDRGQTDFILKGEDDIRRLTDGGVLIADAHGIQFRIRDLVQLDKASRRLLDRFL
jgi:hypothetical protein